MKFHVGFYPKPQGHKFFSIYNIIYGCEKLTAVWLGTLCIEISR